jgi:hypothetical protein
LMSSDRHASAPRSLFVVRCSLFVVRCRSLVVGHWLLVVTRSSFPPMRRAALHPPPRSPGCRYCRR